MTLWETYEQGDRNHPRQLLIADLKEVLVSSFEAIKNKAKKKDSLQENFSLKLFCKKSCNTRE